jgi:hypothetical protein
MGQLCRKGSSIVVSQNSGRGRGDRFCEGKTVGSIFQECDSFTHLRWAELLVHA